VEGGRRAVAAGWPDLGEEAETTRNNCFGVVWRRKNNEKSDVGVYFAL
jgi:hypothetical protein